METGSSSLSQSTGGAAEWGSVRLPDRVDYAALRATIGIREVLALLEWRPSSVNGPQHRGPCPLHGGRSPLSRSFSVHVEKNAFQCFECGRKGNQLDLFARATGMPLYAAALELRRQVGIDPSATADSAGREGREVKFNIPVRPVSGSSGN